LFCFSKVVEVENFRFDIGGYVMKIDMRRTLSFCEERQSMLSGLRQTSSCIEVSGCRHSCGHCSNFGLLDILLLDFRGILFNLLGLHDWLHLFSTVIQVSEHIYTLALVPFALLDEFA
jgi:hypothetical protein